MFTQSLSFSDKEAEALEKLSNFCKVCPTGCTWEGQGLYLGGLTPNPWAVFLRMLLCVYLSVQKRITHGHLRQFWVTILTFSLPVWLWIDCTASPSWPLATLAFFLLRPFAFWKAFSTTFPWLTCHYQTCYLNATSSQSTPVEMAAPLLTNHSGTFPSECLFVLKTRLFKPCLFLIFPARMSVPCGALSCSHH